MKKNTNKKPIPQPTDADRLSVRMLVRAREDFQSQRKRMDNRLGRKADGEDQKVEQREFLPEDMPHFVKISDASRTQEKEIEKALKKVLKRFPIYTEWLTEVKGVGTIAAATIIAEFDIHIATTVSKMWQYAGVNPGMMPGKKRVECKDPAKYAPKDGIVVRRADDYVIVQTTELIRGDRMTAGFIAPFNKRLRTALCGVLADGFIKAQAPYALDHYYPYKERLANSDRVISEVRKGGKEQEIAWKDVKPGHRDRAAKRKMIKAFLQDLYNVWRPLEGLTVREPYCEEFLGKRHAG